MRQNSKKILTYSQKSGKFTENFGGRRINKKNRKRTDGKEERILNGLDALTRVIFKYIQEHDGQTILTKNIEADTAITAKTIRKKINLLIDAGYIRRDGKNYFVLKAE